jgi:hypothetical protein
MADLSPGRGDPDGHRRLADVPGHDQRQAEMSQSPKSLTAEQKRQVVFDVELVAAVTFGCGIVFQLTVFATLWIGLVGEALYLVGISPPYSSPNRPD